MNNKGMSSEISEESISLLERFVVLMQDRMSDSIDVNDARKQQVTQVQNSGEYSSNPGSTHTADQARLLSGQLLESILNMLKIKCDITSKI